MIELYTAGTANGYKASITLEELGLGYEVRRLDLAALEQKRPEFLALNPNGRIPVIVDRDDGGLTIFESGAILIHLAEKTGRLMPTDIKGRSREDLGLPPIPNGLYRLEQWHRRNGLSGLFAR